jgi:hypothetical protein
MMDELTKEEFCEQCGIKEDELDKITHALGEAFYQFCLGLDPRICSLNFHKHLEDRKAEVQRQITWRMLYWLIERESEDVEALPPKTPECEAYDSVCNKIFREILPTDVQNKAFDQVERLNGGLGLSWVEIDDGFEAYVGGILKWPTLDKEPN